MSSGLPTTFWLWPFSEAISRTAVDRQFWIFPYIVKRLSSFSRSTLARRKLPWRATGHEALNLAENRPYLAAPRLALFEPESTCADFTADVVHQSASLKVRSDAVRAHLLEGRLYTA
jgi:hypothetical protein